MAATLDAQVEAKRRELEQLNERITQTVGAPCVAEEQGRVEIPRLHAVLKQSGGEERETLSHFQETVPASQCQRLTLSSFPFTFSSPFLTSRPRRVSNEALGVRRHISTSLARYVVPPPSVLRWPLLVSRALTVAFVCLTLSGSCLLCILPHLSRLGDSGKRGAASRESPPPAEREREARSDNGRLRSVVSGG